MQIPDFLQQRLKELDDKQQLDTLLTTHTEEALQNLIDSFGETAERICDPLRMLRVPLTKGQIYTLAESTLVLGISEYKRSYIMP